MIKKLILLGCIILSIPISAHERGPWYLIGRHPDPNSYSGPNFYVSTTGSNSNDGSIGSPWLTIIYGVSQLSAGDTLYIRSGTYTEGIINGLPSGTSWSNRIRIAAYPGETVWMNPTSAFQAALYLSTDVFYVDFDGINMDCTDCSGSTVIQFDLDEGTGEPHHIRIQNSEVIGNYNMRFAGLILAGEHIVVGAQGGFEFINLVIHKGGGPDGGPLADAEYGIYLAGPNNIVDGCEIYDVTLAGIQVYNGGGDSADNNIIRNTIVHDINRSANNLLLGMLIIGNNNQIYNNIIYGLGNGVTNSGNAAIGVGGGSDGTKVWNNTIYNNENTGIFIDSGTSNTDVINNIAYLSTGSNYINSSGTTTSLTNLFGTDPVFVNAGANNFHIQTSSPAKNAGTTIASVPYDKDGYTRPQGSAYCIGAYEFH